MSAKADDYYPGVRMQRTLFLIKDHRLDYPVVLDLYRIVSEAEHQYDYPIHFRGQLIATNVKYSVNTTLQEPLGNDFGYQHIWEQGRGQTSDSIKLTWLDGDRYYSLVSAAAANAEILFGRTGANDPDFNLRSEPMVILRRQAGDHLFASVIEPHGYFSEAGEKSDKASGSIYSVKVVGHDATGSVVEIEGKNNLKWRIMVNNGEADSGKDRKVSFAGREYEWVGNFKVELD